MTVLHSHQIILLFASQNEEALIGILETAINACGADIMNGAGLWSRLIDIHLENLEDLTDTAASPDAIQSAKEKIVSTYRRQFALPLLGNQRSMSKFESVLSDICIESDAQWIRPEVLLEKFHRSEEQLAARIIYEQNVLSEEFSSSSLDDQVTAWKTYIRFEIDEKELSRAHRLYERSVLTCHQCIELWTEFADFAATTLKEWPLVASVTGRAVKVHRSQIQLWLQHFLAIEAAGPPSSSSSASQKSPQILSSSFAELSTKKENMGDHTTQSTEQKLMLSIQTALTCSFYTADDYLSVLLYSCDCRRRLLKHHLLQANHLVESAKSVDPESTTLMRTTLIGAVTALRNSFMEAENFLNVYYPEWGSGWLQLYKYNSSVEDEIIGDVAEILENDALNSESPDDSTTDLSSNAGNIWEKSVTRFSKYFFSWGEYITWGRAAGDFELCRSLYCRALKAVKDLPEELCQAYLLFERQAGTISDYCTARARTKTILKNVAQKASKALLFAKEQSKAKSLKKMAKIPDTLFSSVVINSHSDAKEKKTLAENHVSEDHMSEEGAIETVGHSQRKRDFSEHITSDSSNVVTTSDHAIDTNKRSKGADSAAHISSSSGVKTIETCWVCIKNLSFKSTIDAVLDLFKPCGEIEEGVLLLTKAGNSRGQATIHYFDSSSALKAVQLNGALIDERPVEVELDFSHESEVTGQANSSSTKAVSAHHPTTVFVSKFSKDLTSDQLRAMFLECGDILEARVIVDKRTGQSKVRTDFHFTYILSECQPITII